jgi:Ca-activated chloride channel family protein
MFAEPLSLLALAVLAPLGWLWRLDRRRRAASDEAYGGAPELRRGRSGGRERLRDAMLGAALVLLVVAIARPQWGFAEAPVERRGIDIAIALDVSRSMTATDVLPSRAAAAANGLDTLFTHLRSDRVGLVIFAGRTFERSPLTLDLDAVSQLVRQAQRDSELVGPGTDLGQAIYEALTLLRVEDAAESQVILVVSDGEDLGETALAAAEVAAEEGVAVYTVAVGTEAGAPIPGDAPGIEQSRADRATLQAVAEATGGDFRELEAVAGLAIDVQRLRQSVFDEARARQPIERFQWFLAPALALLVVQALVSEAGRPRALTRLQAGSAAALGVLVVGACGGSALYQQVERGNEAYEEARYDDALFAYREALLSGPAEPVIGYNAGNTLHQLRRFEEAAVASGDALALTEDTELARWLGYALGNHSVERGLLEDARRRYVDVLRLDPEDRDAKANLELVLRLMDEAAPEVEPEPPEGQPGEENGDGAEPGGEGSSGDAGSATATPDPGSGPGGEQPTPTPPPEGSGPGEGPDGVEGDPADGDGEGGDAGAGGAPGGGPQQTLTAEEAAAALRAALAEAGDELSLEEALRLLELARQLSALEALDPSNSETGGFSDR